MRKLNAFSLRKEVRYEGGARPQELTLNLEKLERKKMVLSVMYVLKIITS